jgi:hypothetical protein
MRRNEIILAVVFMASVIGAGLLAHVLHNQQAEFSKSRGLVHKMPIAGFQKFMADVVWMRFLYYAGSNQLDATTADEYDRFIQLIIALDPDFYRAYYMGALMLGPVDSEKALKLVDMGDEHPRISKKWELQMMGGGIIMRKQSRNHYSNKEMDLKEVAKANVYFRRAKDLPDCKQSALNSFIWTKALCNPNGFPREINELTEWHEYWKNTRYSDSDPDGGSSMMSGAVIERIIGQIKKLAKKYVKAEDAKPEMKKKAEALILAVISDIFPRRQFDVESYIPYETGNATLYRGTIESPRDDKSYMVELDASAAYAVGLLTAKTSTGTAKITVLINGEQVNGLTAIPVGPAKAEFPALVAAPEKKETVKEKKREVNEDRKILDLPPAKTTPAVKLMVRMPLRANKGKKGSVIEIRVSDTAKAKDLSYILTVYPGEYF